jgi:hypothetical protein
MIAVVVEMIFSPHDLAILSCIIAVANGHERRRGMVCTGCDRSPFTEGAGGRDRTVRRGRFA